MSIPPSGILEEFAVAVKFSNKAGNLNVFQRYFVIWKVPTVGHG